MIVLQICIVSRHEVVGGVDKSEGGARFEKWPGEVGGEIEIAREGAIGRADTGPVSADLGNFSMSSGARRVRVPFCGWHVR